MGVSVNSESTDTHCHLSSMRLNLLTLTLLLSKMVQTQCFSKNFKLTSRQRLYRNVSYHLVCGTVGYTDVSVVDFSYKVVLYINVLLPGAAYQILGDSYGSLIVIKDLNGLEFYSHFLIQLLKE